MIAAVELDETDYGDGENRTGLVERVLQEMYANKVMIRSLGGVVYLMLPLTSPPDVVSKAADLFVQTIRLLTTDRKSARSPVAVPGE